MDDMMISARQFAPYSAIDFRYVALLESCSRFARGRLKQEIARRAVSTEHHGCERNENVCTSDCGKWKSVELIYVLYAIEPRV